VLAQVMVKYWDYSFYRAMQLCYRGLGSRNSVRPSVTCVLCD